jgi:flagellar M-ring protein FliF
MSPGASSGAGATLMGAGGIPVIAGPAGLMALPAPGGFPGGYQSTATAAQLEDEAMVSMGQIEGQMRASSLRKLSDIVSKHPDETLTIMRGWMAQENG